MEAEADDVRRPNVEVRREATSVTALAARDQGRSVRRLEGFVPTDEPEVDFRPERHRLTEREGETRPCTTDTDRTEPTRLAVADRTPDEPGDRLGDGSVEPRADGGQSPGGVTSLAEDELPTELRPDEHALATALELTDVAFDGSEAPFDAIHPTLEPRDLLVDRLLPGFEREFERLPLDEQLGVVRENRVTGLRIDEVEPRDLLLVRLELAALRGGELLLVEQVHLRLELRDLSREILGGGAGHVSRLAPHGDREQPNGALAAVPFALLRRRSVADEGDRLGGGHLLVVVLVTIVEGRLALGIGRRHRVDVTLAGFVG